MTSLDWRRSPHVCDAAILPPVPLILGAHRFDPTGTTALYEVEDKPLCTLAETHRGPHYGLALDLPGVDTGSVWAVWATGATPALIRLPDCPATTDDRSEVCGLWDQHPGLHSWQLYDREAALAKARLAGPL